MAEMDEHKKFNIEYRFRHAMGLLFKDPAAIPEQQLMEMERVFYAGYASCLQCTDDIAELSDTRAVSGLRNQHVQAKRYWAQFLPKA